MNGKTRHGSEGVSGVMIEAGSGDICEGAAQTRLQVDVHIVISHFTGLKTCKILIQSACMYSAIYLHIINKCIIPNIHHFSCF